MPIVLVGVVPANAGNLIAYHNASYGGGELVNAPSAPYIDVSDNAVSSVKNQTSNRFSGRNAILGGSVEVQSFNSGANNANLGFGVNDVIDHFDRA